MSRKLTFITIALVGLVLLVLLAGLTMERLNRTERLWRDSLTKQGLFILGSMEASTRAGMRMMGQGVQLRRLQFMAEELGQVGLVVSVFVIDPKGGVLIHSDPKKVGLISADSNVLWARGDPAWAGFAKDTFVVLRRFRPMGPPGHMGLGRPRPPFSETPQLGVVHLPLAEFKAAQRAELYQSVGLGAAIFISGLALIVVLLFVHDRRLLNRLQQKTDHLVDSMPAGLLSADSQGRLLTANLAIRRILDLGGVNLSEKRLNDYLPPGICTRLEGLAEDRTLAETAAEMALNERTIPVSLSAVRLEPTSEDPTALIILIRDLTRVRELEEQLKRSERLAALGRLSAGVAHEIRNPLSSIRGLAQYLKGKMDPESEEAGYAEVMIGEADRLNRVVTDLLAYARPKPPSLARGDLSEIISRVVELTRPQAEEKGVNLELSGAGEPLELDIDGDQITQVALNLLLNALDSGGRTVSVELEAGTNRALLRVSDNGPGVAPADKDHIFDPFFTTKDQGSGLGLAISVRIVEEHGGALSLKDSSVGAVFEIELPLNG